MSNFFHADSKNSIERENNENIKALDAIKDSVISIKDKTKKFESSILENSGDEITELTIQNKDTLLGYLNTLATWKINPITGLFENKDTTTKPPP